MYTLPRKLEPMPPNLYASIMYLRTRWLRLIKYIGTELADALNDTIILAVYAVRTSIMQTIPSA